MLNIKDLRREYSSKSLDLRDLNKDPFIQFQSWLQEAISAEVLEPNAMVLATASIQARPSSRTVLLKGIDATGLRFFTNYRSRKAKELITNPYGSITFFWKELERQVIVEGSVEQLTVEESTAYFAGRPRGSQLGAWASQQGEIVVSREILENQFEEVSKQFENQPVPIPPGWGGFRLIPTYFEFWQGRKNRLHDRFHYQLIDHQWKIERLSP